jgi:hypothetical protein
LKLIENLQETEDLMVLWDGLQCRRPSNLTARRRQHSASADASSNVGIGTLWSKNMKGASIEKINPREAKLLL